MFMPLGLTADLQNDLNLVENQKNFIFFYFDLWPCVISTLMTSLLTPVSRMLIYEEPIDTAAVANTVLLVVQ